MSLAKRYTPTEIESKWYAHWIEQNYFASTPDDREPYTIVIPPPNVTGVLHMGHMLNNTIQDIYIRKARKEGKNACWVPGTDHASIATEAKVVKKLREQGITKADISREEFLQHAFEWKEKYGGIILEQLKKLGASCDWSRTRFTMEPALSSAVVKVFNDLYKKGRLYRGLRMTNWDPEAKTALSNEEVIYKEENATLYHVRYQIEGTKDEWITIATVRPETILGDTAIATHPDDERYQHLKGKSAIVPLINRSIPIIQDDYVDMEFGTGGLKVTPAHDTNDYDIGLRHNLAVIDVLNEDGTMSEAAQLLIGEDRFIARKKISKLLEESGHLIKKEPYRTKLGRSERTHAVVEPRLTRQWFLKMDEFAETALKAVESGEVTFFPKHFWNMYYNWLRAENVRDWCISRQLWWGQQIPAWYLDDHIFVAHTAEEALKQAQETLQNPSLSLDDLKQDEDVVDTWFSSWLWPMSVFDAFEDSTEMAYYYPTNLLVTGWDIMFFWVARMIMAGYEWAPDLLSENQISTKGRHPFNDVFFTGMVRDNQRRKMSKQLGNSPDALELIDRYGADGVRFGLLSAASAGNDIIFDAPIDQATKKALNESKLCEQGLNFCNKMWNALRLIKGWEIEKGTAPTLPQQLAIRWFEHRLNAEIEALEKGLSAYRLAEVTMSLYSFIWNDFCSWYLEMIKPEYGGKIREETLNQTLSFFETITSMLHPIMPFVTEEIWQQLKDRSAGDDCVVSPFPKARAYDEKLIQQVEQIKDIISNLRDTRNQKGLKAKDLLVMYAQSTPEVKALFNLPGFSEMLPKMAYLEAFKLTEEAQIENSISFVAGATKFFVEVDLEIDVEAEKGKIEEEIAYQKGFVEKVNKKLQNERFVNNAPAQVVEKERKKLEDGLARIKTLEESLRNL